MKHINALNLSFMTIFFLCSAWCASAMPPSQRVPLTGSLRDFYMEFRRGRSVLPSDLTQLENHLRNLPRTGVSFRGNDSQRATPSDSLNVRMVGRWPYGPSYTIAVDRERHLAFLGSGGAVLVLDLSDPWDPAKIGEITTPGMVSALFYANSILYVAAGGAGFRMISMENPSLPEELGSYDTYAYAWAVAATDSFAYVIDFKEYDWTLHVLSISDPAHIQEEGVFPSPSEISFAWNLAVEDSLVFIAADYEGLLILSVSNPEWIYEVGSYSTPFSAVSDVAVSDTLAYVTAWNEGLLILSIADPSNPVLKGSSNPSGAFELSVTVSDSFAYTTGINSLRIISVTDPEHPIELGRSDSLSWALDIAQVGTYAYVADSWEGMWTISTMDPSHPVVHRSHEGESWSDGVAVSDTLVTVAHGEKGLLVLSVSDPARPRKLGYYDPDGEEWVDMIASTQRYAYLTGSDFYFTVFSLFDPSSPEMLGAFPLRAEGMCVSGDYAYLAAGDLHIISVTDPENLFEIGSCETPGSAIDIVVSYPYAYAADMSGLCTFDISDPSMPQTLGYYSLPSFTTNVALFHYAAFTASLEDGFYMFDVSDPANLLQLNHCAHLPHPVRDIDILHGLVCVAGGEDGGLRVFDPATCEELGYYDTPGQALRIVVSDSLVYVADGESGIIILEYLGPNSIEGPGVESPSLPPVFSLSQNYPNPFNPITTITFDIPGEPGAKQYVNLIVYNLRGRHMKTLIDSELDPGSHIVMWDGKNEQGEHVSSGIYLYTLKSGDKRYTRKMVAVK